MVGNGLEVRRVCRVLEFVEGSVAHGGRDIELLFGTGGQKSLDDGVEFGTATGRGIDQVQCGRDASLVAGSRGAALGDGCAGHVKGGLADVACAHGLGADHLCDASKRLGWGRSVSTVATVRDDGDRGDLPISGSVENCSAAVFSSALFRVTVLAVSLLSDEVSFSAAC